MKKSINLSGHTFLNELTQKGFSISEITSYMSTRCNFNNTLRYYAPPTNDELRERYLEWVNDDSQQER